MLRYSFKTATCSVRVAGFHLLHVDGEDQPQTRFVSFVAIYLCLLLSGCEMGILSIHLLGYGVVIFVLA